MDAAKVDEPFVPSGRNLVAWLEWSIGLYQSGLRDTQMLVLGALMEGLVATGAEDDSETTVQVSRWEIARRTKLSPQQVQRALATLVEAGFIARLQLGKRDGGVARTLLTRKAFVAMGIDGGVQIDDGTPGELATLLIGEVKEVADAVTTAWRTSSPIPIGIGSLYRGGTRRWAQIEFLLEARVEEQVATLLKAIDKAERAAEPEARGK
jgi:hypothetical protein